MKSFRYIFDHLIKFVAEIIFFLILIIRVRNDNRMRWFICNLCVERIFRLSRPIWYVKWHNNHFCWIILHIRWHAKMDFNYWLWFCFHWEPFNLLLQMVGIIYVFFFFKYLVLICFYVQFDRELTIQLLS